jgi:hypothetical protein
MRWGGSSRRAADHNDLTAASKVVVDSTSALTVLKHFPAHWRGRKTMVAKHIFSDRMYTRSGHRTRIHRIKDGEGRAGERLAATVQAMGADDARARRSARAEVAVVRRRGSYFGAGVM